MATKDWKAIINRFLSEKNSFVTGLEKIQKKTGIPKVYLLGGLGLLAGVVFLGLFWLFIQHGSQRVCFLLGIMYPAYSSVKALEKNDANEQKRCLTYWVVYATFNVLEIIVFWLPFFWLLKLLFLVYVTAPASWNGSSLIYTKFVHPFYTKYYKDVDAVLDRAVLIAGSATTDAVREMGKEAVTGAVKKHVESMMAGSGLPSPAVLKNRQQPAAETSTAHTIIAANANKND